MEETVGALEGVVVGAALFDTDGVVLDKADGAGLAFNDGNSERLIDGGKVGTRDEDKVGLKDTSTVGVALGDTDFVTVGVVLGVTLKLMVGDDEGTVEMVGEAEGASKHEILRTSKNFVSSNKALATKPADSEQPTGLHKGNETYSTTLFVALISVVMVGGVTVWVVAMASTKQSLAPVA